jgi:hypothetical protein
MTPHPILERHLINDRFGEGLREAARRRLIKEACQQDTPASPFSRRSGLTRRLRAAWAVWPRRTRVTPTSVG